MLLSIEKMVMTVSSMEKSQAVKALLTMMLVVLLSCAGIALPYPILAPLFLNEVSSLTTFAGIPPKLLLGLILAIYPLGEAK